MICLYFAWLKNKIGMEKEELSPPPEVKTVQDLLIWLKNKSPAHKEALSDFSLIRIAVNQNYANLNHPLEKDDEVALFPPVTGG